MTSRDNETAMIGVRSMADGIRTITIVARLLVHSELISPTHPTLVFDIEISNCAFYITFFERIYIRGSDERKSYDC